MSTSTSSFNNSGSNIIMFLVGSIIIHLLNPVIVVIRMLRSARRGVLKSHTWCPEKSHESRIHIASDGEVETLTTLTLLFATNNSAVVLLLYVVIETLQFLRCACLEMMGETCSWVPTYGKFVCWSVHFVLHAIYAALRVPRIILLKASIAHGCEHK